MAKIVHEYRVTSVIGCFSTYGTFKYTKAISKNKTLLEAGADAFKKKYFGCGLEATGEKTGYILGEENARIFEMRID